MVSHSVVTVINLISSAITHECVAYGKRKNTNNLRWRMKMRNMDKIAEKMSTVMGEYKDKELKTSAGKKVKSRKQAIAIAMSEADAMKKKGK